MEYERYYGSVLHSFFAPINCDVIAEDTMNYGQANLTVKMKNDSGVENIYVMEIKFVKGVKVKGNSALKQIEDIGYSKKYVGKNDVKVF